MKTSHWARAAKHVFVGRARELTEDGLFHKLSLVAVLAWVGLGADGLSSSCYGPEEVYKALLSHPSLALVVALMSAATVVIICASYSQIIAQFPSGGGGYVVASRLLSPTAGVVSGAALIVDYVLTIAMSVASAMDALFSFLPAHWAGAKLVAALGGVLFLTIVNLRGVRESVLLWAPVFFVFLGTHLFAIGYAWATHARELVSLPGETMTAATTVWGEVGLLGLLAVLLRAYSMGAGTYTGIEAVSNGLPILREPCVQTGRRTMLLIAASLSVMVAGLLVAYLLLRVQPVAGKTLNAVLLEQLAAGWPDWLGRTFVCTALGSAAALLFIAAQAGFLDGPRVLANMAIDRWMPSRFAALSDRFVTLNGVVLMGATASLALVLTQASVALLVVLYSINVFITFTLSQLGMVRHVWQTRHERRRWKARLSVNATGLALTAFILATLVYLKFHDGGWITLVITAALVAAAFGIRRHYAHTSRQLARLDELVTAAAHAPVAGARSLAVEPGTRGARTAILLVNGFNGLGLHTLFGARQLFGAPLRRFVFVSVGVIDAGNFKGGDEIERLRAHTRSEAERYAEFVRARGGEAEVFTALGQDVVSEVEKLLPALMTRFPDAVFFGGQLVFARETMLTRWLHNHTVFALQRHLFVRGLPFAIVPALVDQMAAQVCAGGVTPHRPTAPAV